MSLTHNTDRIPELVATELDSPPQTPIAYCEVIAMLSRLEGVPLRRKDLLAAAIIGGVIRRVDDTFDRGPIDTAHQQGCAVTDAVLHPGEATLQHVTDPRITKAISMAHDTFTPEALDALKNLMRAQLDSVQQRLPATPSSVIEDITRRKATFFLFAVQVNCSMGPERANCYRELAYLLQLIDDYADYDEDRFAGIHTPVTRSASDTDAVRLILTQYRKVKNLFLKEYKPPQLIEPFSYIDQLLKTVGIVF
ncbi:MAG: hypothetical protein UT55_C0028G0004 [Candidatus Peregrinibacteria bacterium GW2011_GWE2_39_6]|nr:MAG: hypothetical protein UT36_C0010G0033 [Candidatus Peregrinibacteria bacterium GW2011_GWF2_39_17]KKR25817.1 MAG: hypothetical protein UT55_C0028G0004 [Candidatus Peregrinibacteria bacterium GW2011_GWE2_39_6]HCW32279.1 hypothetical protein [Candidatus Peregrinibacteria bacterium]